MERFKVKDLYMTCGACPSQWEGTTECGKELYMRCRHGYFYMTIDGVKTVECDVSNYDIDGVMSEEVMKALCFAYLEF